MSSLNCSVSKQLLFRARRHVRTSVFLSRSQNYCAALNEVLANSVNCIKSREFITFNQLIASRKDEASRSIVVQVKSESSYQDLFSYCSNFGDVKNAFYYNIINSDNRNQFILIEFNDVAGSQGALNGSTHSNKESIVPVQSPFLWFRSNLKMTQLKSNFPELKMEPTVPPSNSQLSEVFSQSDSFAEDMMLLYKYTKLSDIATRLRFVTAAQLENAFKGLFPSGHVLPFGSSVNSFGKINSDLDLVFELNDQPSTNSRLVFHSKGLHGMSKIHNQRHLETIADIVQYFLPGCCNTRRILRARVPIIRYKHDITGVECDLSSNNSSGVFMSELLYLLASYDWRVCPLIFTVRYWAKETSLTNPAPGKWVTNFTLSLLTLFFLQYEKIIPSIDTLLQQKRSQDEKSFVDENGETISCGFLSDLNLLKNPGTVQNDDSLAILLMKFFEFYASFDFRSNAISLNSGSILVKPLYDPVYIVNPLEKALNVSRNVSTEECERLRMQLRNAAWNMECSLNSPHKKKWGLRDLIDSHFLNKSNFPRATGMKGSCKVTIKDLFLDN